MNDCLEQGFLAVLDLFDSFNVLTTTVEPKVAFQREIALDCRLFHWWVRLDAECGRCNRTRLQNHRTVVIAAGSVQIYDGYLEWVDSVLTDAVEPSTCIDDGVQQFMRDKCLAPTGRIKVWNPIYNRYEIHHSSNWKGTTNILSSRQRPFPTAPNVSYIDCREFVDTNARIWTADGLKEVNRPSGGNHQTNDQQCHFHEICTLDEWYSPHRRRYMRIVGLENDLGNPTERTLKIIELAWKETCWSISSLHQFRWPIYSHSNYWSNFLPDQCIRPAGRISYCNYQPMLTFSPNHWETSHSQPIFLFAYDDNGKFIKVIRVRMDGHLENADNLELPIHATSTTTFFHLSLPMFVRISHNGTPEDCFIDMFTMKWTRQTATWSLHHAAELQIQKRVWQCKLCPCGKVLAYLFTESRSQSVMRIVSANDGMSLAECEIANDIIQFCHSRDSVCLLLQTRCDRTFNFMRIIAVTEDGRFATSNLIHSRYIDYIRTDKFRCAFSSCGNYLTCWNLEYSMYLNYKISVIQSDASVSCTVTLVNQACLPVSLTLCNQSCVVAFDQRSKCI